jgi:crotonobetainyl-CoA:carnitine CoA-transferase CaiB-like acyl-CoA transferase
LTGDPHLKAVGLLGFENHPTEGKTAVIRSTINIDGKYPSARSTAAPCGWDTDEILSELGFSPSEKASLMSQKAIFSHEK